MNRRTPLAACLAAASLALLLHPAAATAALFVPTKTSDGADGSCDERDCSLREAVVAANALPGEDVVLLAPGVYALTLAGDEDAALAGDLDVTDDLVLAGGAALDTIVDAGGIDRVIEIAAGASLEVRDVTLRHGAANGPGGGIENAGDLTLLRMVLSGNRSVGADGGGVFSDSPAASLTIRESTVSHNSAEGGDGGGIATGGAAGLANVTVALNAATGTGGGIHVFANSTTRIDNATIARNSAQEGGGIFAESSAFTGLPPRVANSILATNTAPSSPDCSGAIATTWSLIGDASGCTRPSGSNDLAGSGGAPLDPKLFPLQEAGGPTPTQPLEAGSPAIDAASPEPPGTGDPACLATDQRGADRPAGARCDIGAFEVTTECVPGGGVLCLQDGRFAVRATFQTAGGLSGTGRAVTLTPDSGYFWFFDPANVEVTVKVLDGCALNQRYWAFSAGMTNVRVDLLVTDTATGVTKTYTNPLNRVYRTRLDTAAFPCG
jgi:CSLREA domain-containing protein